MDGWYKFIESVFGDSKERGVQNFNGLKEFLLKEVSQGPSDRIQNFIRFPFAVFSMNVPFILST